MIAIKQLVAEYAELISPSVASLFPVPTKNARNID